MKRPRLPDARSLCAMDDIQLNRCLRRHSDYWAWAGYYKPEQLPVGDQVAYRVLSEEKARRGLQLRLY